MRRRRAQPNIAPMCSGQLVLSTLPDDPIEALILRARKLRKKGDVRRSLVMLRQACALDEWRARSFTILGAQLACEGLMEEAVCAFNHARWLRARAGEKARAAVTRRLSCELLSVAA